MALQVDLISLVAVLNDTVVSIFVRETSNHEIERTLNPVAKALLQLRFPGAKVFGGFGAARLFPEPLGFDLGLRQDTLLFRPFLRGRHCGSVYHRRRLDCDNDQSSEYELRIGDYRKLAT
jgi:hypothetical protein